VHLALEEAPSVLFDGQTPAPGQDVLAGVLPPRPACAGAGSRLA
jgi:hypothetical protein